MLTCSLTFLWMVFYLIFSIIKRTFSYVTLAIGGLYGMIGLLLIAIGFCGVYIGRIYDEAKGRPLYLVSNTLGYEEEEEIDR